MRFIFLFGTVLLITACNNEAKKDNNEVTDTTKTSVTPPPVVTDTLFSGFGTEPFWAVYVIGNQKIVFHPADGPDAEFPFDRPSSPDNLTTVYSSSNGNATLQLKTIKKDCSDGMSEFVYPYAVELMVNAITYNGCGIIGSR